MPIRRDTPTYELILSYRCPACNGRGAVQQIGDGEPTRTMVMHTTSCRIKRMVETFFPILYKNLETGNVLFNER